MKKCFLALCAAALFSMSAHAAYDLQITEIYFGQTNPDVTEDWFEITNLGNSAWTEATDGTLYYDDFAPDPTKADPIEGISSIAPGQSVIVVVADATGVTDFQAAWSNLPGLTVGNADGSGLSSSKVDGATIWINDPNAGGTLLDTETYPNPEDVIGLLDGASYDVLLGDFSSLATGATESVGLGGGDEIIPVFQPSTATPGYQATAVPEPAAVALLAFAAVGFAGRRR